MMQCSVACYSSAGEGEANEGGGGGGGRWGGGSLRKHHVEGHC